MQRTILVMIAVLATTVVARPSAKGSKINSLRKRKDGGPQFLDPSAGVVSYQELTTFRTDYVVILNKINTFVKEQESEVESNVNNDNDLAEALRVFSKYFSEGAEENFQIYQKFMELTHRAFINGVTGGDGLCAAEDDECIEKREEYKHKVYGRIFDEIISNADSDDVCNNLQSAMFPEENDWKKKRSLTKSGSSDDEDDTLDSLLENLPMIIFSGVSIKVDVPKFKEAFVKDLKCFSKHLASYAQYLNQLASDEAPDAETILEHIARSDVYHDLLILEGWHLVETTNTLQKRLQFKPVTNEDVSKFYSEVTSVFSNLKNYFEDVQTQLKQIQTATGNDLLKPMASIQEDMFKYGLDFYRLREKSDYLAIRAFILGVGDKHVCDVSADDSLTCIAGAVTNMVLSFMIAGDQLEPPEGESVECTALAELKKQTMDGVLQDFIGELIPEGSSKLKSKKSAKIHKHGKGKIGRKAKGKGKRDSPKGDPEGYDIPQEFLDNLNIDIQATRDALVTDISCLSGHLSDVIENLIKTDPQSLSADKLKEVLAQNHVILHWLYKEGGKVFELATEIRYMLQEEVSPEVQPAKKMSKSLSQLKEILGKFGHVMNKRFDGNGDEKTSDSEDISEQGDVHGDDPSANDESESGDIESNPDDDESLPQPASRSFHQLKEALKEFAKIKRAKEDRSPRPNGEDKPSTDDSSHDDWSGEFEEPSRPEDFDAGRTGAGSTGNGGSTKKYGQLLRDIARELKILKKEKY